MKRLTYIDRPPRIQPDLPIGKFDIPRPPGKEENGNLQLLQAALPLVTIIGFVLLSSRGGQSGWLAIPMALSVVAATGMALFSFRREKQKQADKEQAYNERLLELNKEMNNSHDQQRRFYRYNYPDVTTLEQIVASANFEAEKGERTFRAETRLWERRVEDNDFGAVRLGMGTLPSTVVYSISDVEDMDDPQARAAKKLASDSEFVTDIPIIVKLRQPRPTEENEAKPEDAEEAEESVARTPTTHAFGIAGERSAVYQFTRAMLAHYTIFHAPMDAQLYLLSTSRTEWTWALQLPHLRGDEQNSFTCFVDEVKREKDSTLAGDSEGNELEQFLENIRRLLATRKIRLQDREENEGKDDPTIPFILVVVDLLDSTYDEESLLKDLEADAAMTLLLAEGAMLGAAVTFLVPERSKVPTGCLAVVEVERTTPASNSKSQQFQRLHFRYAETGVNSFRYIGEADAFESDDQVDTLAAQMAQLEVRQGFGAKLANNVPFLDLLGYRSVGQLERDAWIKWQESTKDQHSDWLRVKIGRMSGNKPRTLVFSAKKDGVHGMVAGSTGSGKSELLISLITAMGVTYDPTALNFVLVDFKGGGTFADFERLPHCVDIITNIGPDGVTRMFTAITAEMQRRQTLNAETGTKNIVDYRQKGLHLSHKPYPFLFIIIDEFAEMVAERPEYKMQLESITRVGRAQGVSLILAAQRPTGVTDQMRSNIKFRICLRVETSGESREMLRRADAAFLPSIPGRGYLQVGNDEIELIQVAYAGEKYVDPRRQRPAAPVLWPDRPRSKDTQQDQEPPEIYKEVVSRLSRLAVNHNIKKQRAPWPGFLPRQLFLTETLLANDPATKAVTSKEYISDFDIRRIRLGRSSDENVTLNPSLNQWINNESGWVEKWDWENFAMRPVVGLIDNPYAAKQLPLIVNLPQDHVVLLGASGWGKTTFIRSLVLSLAASHSPDHAHIYILDLGGRSLGILGRLPHAGAVIFPDEEGFVERVEQLLRELDTMLDKRKDVLNNAGVTDLYKYNAQNPQAALPAVLVAIDNFAVFKETFGEGTDAVESVLDRFIVLARESKNYGIHFVITIDRLSLLSNQLFSIFTERLTLKLADPTEYRSVVGAPVSDISNIQGRGYIKGEYKGEPIGLSFQIAQPVDLRGVGQEAAKNETHEIESIIHSMDEFMARSTHQYRKPIYVNALPKSLLFKQLLARQLGASVDEHFLETLKSWARQNWINSREAAHAEWLRVCLGVVSGDRPREMHLEAKLDGVHGLIAGGTGSGKSELLMTLIVGLALNYDPSILNFVLVDYKGGGAFQPFSELPHVVDTVTNLNKSAVRRMFTAIGAEMQRRQRLNTETRTKDIVEYRAKGYHQRLPDGSAGIPYPHLFIIIDEYAEMISDSPEFKSELDSITRLGRAQGINLLLASQRPTGVTDQMRENIKYRICLRVESVDTSREMLRRSDAAFLPSGMPGRGYLQIGNEAVELIQIAYTGENYEYGKEYGDVRAEMRESGQKPKFYDMIVAMAQELLQEQRPATPWPPSLPTQLRLTTPLAGNYLDRSYADLITLGTTARVESLNPHLQGWLQGQVGWGHIDWAKNAMRGVVGLIDDPAGARQLPLVVDLTRGHTVLFGASGWGKTAFMRTLIVSLAATHSPDEFHAHILDLGGRNLDVLKALPQVGTVIMPDESGYEERVQQLLRELNDEIDRRKLLFSDAGVQTLYEYNSSSETQIKPAILVVIDNFAEFIETFAGSGGKEDAENNVLTRFVALARQSKPFGLHFVISATRVNVLPNKLFSLFPERLTLRLSDSGDYSTVVGAYIGDIDEIPGRGYVRVGRAPLEFQVAVAAGDFDPQSQQLRGEAQQIRTLGAKMHELGRWTSKGPLKIDALPTTSSYRRVLALPEIFNLNAEEEFLGALKDAMLHEWAKTGSAEGADWLSVPLGIVSGNRPRTLNLAAKRDGVHGLVAGGTGSGKSELLMTLIVGLALRYSPSILNFVLVDYKGGGAFKPFEKLPHCVDMVTNLGKAGVHRMFTAINAEMRRRQKLNVDTATKDIVEYRQKGYHLRWPDGSPGIAYPHLFIIIDEYAEMIDDNPDYRAELESITRVGRAQGVNLLLASQRPKGVSDQMRANIKLRLCLRVEETDTSMELLRRPDAAYLPNGMPGRGYLQIGNDNPELIQVSYTGESQPDEREEMVFWPDRDERVSAQGGEETPKFYDAVVGLSSEANDGKMAPRLWPAFLSPRLSLQSPVFDSQKNEFFTLTDAVSDWLNGDVGRGWPGVNWRDGALRPIVGLIDDPAEARQYPLEIDLNRNHLAVFGDAGSGKTSFLRTIMTALAATHSPEEIHFYVLDLGGHNFSTLEELPHVGAVISADEEDYEERLGRLVARVEFVATERQKLFGKKGVSNLREYNEQTPEEILPALVVVIDNFAVMRENHEMLLENTITPLIRRSLSVGITFVIASNSNLEVPSKVYNLFGERLTFQQTNADRYQDIVGRGVVGLEDLPGRGYLRRDGRALQFQAALPVGLFASVDGRDMRSEVEELRWLTGQMRAKSASYKLPEPIRTLPKLVALRQILATDLGPAGRGRILAPLGQDSSLQPAILDLKRLGPHFAVTGPPLSGKSTTLYSWVFALTKNYSPQQLMVILIDLQARFIHYGGNEGLHKLPHVAATVVDPSELPALAQKLEAECLTFDGDSNAVNNNGSSNGNNAESSKREIYVIIDNFDELSDETINTRDGDVRNAGQMLARIARRYGARGVHFIAAGTFGSTSDLGRNIMASNYGIGLRTGSALDTLRVSRIPVSLRDKEQNIGRGFIVKSGQITQVQVATPYQDNSDLEIVGDDEGARDDLGADNETRNPMALDRWVSEIKARWQDAPPVTWLHMGEQENVAAPTTEQVVESVQVVAMRSLLERAMRWELTTPQNGDGATLTLNWLGLSRAEQSLESVLFKLCREALIKRLRADGMPDPEIFVDLFQDAENLVMTAQDYFPVVDSAAVSQNGHNGS